MNVLILSHYQTISPRVVNEARALRDRYRVRILAWKRDQTGTPNGAGPEVDWVYMKAPRGQLSVMLYLPLLYWRMLRALRGEPCDVVHCTHLMLLPLSLFIARRKRAKLVYDAYERHAHILASRLPAPRRAESAIEGLENRLVRKADGVLTVDSPRDMLETRYRRYNPRVAVLYNVPFLSDFEGQSRDGSASDSAAQPTLAYVGGMSIKKGILKAIEALKIVRDSNPSVKMLLIGRFQNGEEDAKRLMNEYSLHDNVEVIEWLPYWDMMQYLRDADVGLALHQPWEEFRFVAKGTGRKFFTYMQAGLPIVGPEYAEIGQAVRDEGCGLLVDTTDPQAIAEAVLYLLEHPAEAAHMGHNGRQAVEQKYNWDVEKQKLLQLYRELEAE